MKNILLGLSLFVCFQTQAQNLINPSKIEKNLVLLDSNVYVCKFEVSNQEYRDFQLAIIGDTKVSKVAKVDSTGWQKYVNNLKELEAYHKHEAFNAYPVVNISYDAAVAYCKWLTDIYNQTPGRKYKKVVFRLPSELEWERAARAKTNTTQMYAWDGLDIMDKKGNYLCNFKDINQTISPESRIKSDHFMITAPVKSFDANKLGLYNMCGNVAEMVAEKVYTKGGGWNSSREKVQVKESETFEGANANTGFRYFMQIIEF